MFVTQEDCAKQFAIVMQATQIAVIHLVSHLERNGLLKKEDVAASYERTAATLPPDLNGRDVTQQVLRGIAIGLREAGTGGPRVVK